MKKIEFLTADLMKYANEYREWCLSDENNDPFKTNNAFWAMGYQSFLTWLLWKTGRIVDNKPTINDLKGKA